MVKATVWADRCRSSPTTNRVRGDRTTTSPGGLRLAARRRWSGSRFRSSDSAVKVAPLRFGHVGHQNSLAGWRNGDEIARPRRPANTDHRSESARSTSPRRRHHHHDSCPRAGRARLCRLGPSYGRCDRNLFPHRGRMDTETDEHARLAGKCDADQERRCADLASARDRAARSLDLRSLVPLRRRRSRISGNQVRDPVRESPYLQSVEPRPGCDLPRSRK